MDPSSHALVQLTHQNDALVEQLQLGQTDDVSFKSKDGTEVHGMLTKPVGYFTGGKVPLLLRIHGGPERAGRLHVQHRAAMFSRQRLRGARGELPRQRGTRDEVLARDRRRLGPFRGGRPARRVSTT
jgi:hypothetical protein